MRIERITEAGAKTLIHGDESQFIDVKSIDIPPNKLTKTISGLANADGGDLYIGIDEPETGNRNTRVWRGFASQESANGHLQAFEPIFPLGTNYDYEFLACDTLPGLVLHIQINKTQAIAESSSGMPYLRRGAANQPVDTPDKLRRLEYAKGVASFESERTNAHKETVTESCAVKQFVKNVVPESAPEPWLRKQALLREDNPTVAGVLLFADEPQAVLPKRCGIKVYRYKTRDPEGTRESLAFDPRTVEGCLDEQIRTAVATTIEIAESIPKMGDAALEPIKYPSETLHEIITNAVLHRDYNVADDVHIRIFDNRIEVQSPGRLPAHVTVANILKERFARNGAVVRILNKFPDPPNKDVGEGLNTAFAAMKKLGLKDPVIEERESSVMVIIRHEPLASPQEAIMDYLETHDTINNREACAVANVARDYRMKNIFNRMVESGMLEQVPGTRTSNTRYQKAHKTGSTGTPRTA